MANALYRLLAPRHKVFVSFHHGNDWQYRTAFEQLFAASYDVTVSASVQIGEIPPNTPSDVVRARIRDNYLQDSTVTVVLVGSQTWQRKHVDWEIGSSLRETLYNKRSGLIGIVLPTYPRASTQHYDKYTIPPRLSDNIDCGYAKIYSWSNDPSLVSSWIHEAFDRRERVKPDNSYPNFVNNKFGVSWKY